MTVVDSMISENAPSHSVIFVEGHAQLSVYRTLIGENIACSSGKMVCNEGKQSYVDYDYDDYFTINTIGVKNITFLQNNTCTAGTVYMNSWGTTLRLGNTTVNDNYGGVIYALKSTVVITKSTFKHSDAYYDQRGGAISALSSALSIENSMFIGNYAFCRLDECGGAVNVQGTSALTNKNGYTLRISNTTFINNDGGGVYAKNTGVLIVNATFHNNTGEDGGAIYTKNSGLVIESSTFHNNSAHQGGAVHVWSPSEFPIMKSTLRLSDTTFTNNCASYQATAVCVFYSMVQVEDSSFNNNRGIDGPGILRHCRNNICTEECCTHREDFVQ